MSFETPITIAEAMKKIDGNEYLLPAIQREFVWSNDRIEWLFDSIMRNYPISSFLFWYVEGDTVNNYRFYKFISEYRESFKTHNEEFSTNGLRSFVAVLDGQQRLTSLYIGLKGSFAYKEYRRKLQDTEWSIPTRLLYLNITNELVDEEDGRIFEFKFLKKEVTNSSQIYESGEKKWFLVASILKYTDDELFDYFVEEFSDAFARKAIRQLRRTILEKKLINYFLEKEQSIDKALNIFIRINSGGEPLNFSDLIMSIAVANWKQKDARKEIHKLVDTVRDRGFSISKDLVLKTFLFLHSKDIKFRVTNFSKDNAKEFESEWEKIRDCIIEVFDLLNVYGFTDFSLTSKNAIIPVVYYLYHMNIYKDFSTRATYSDDREIIKKWLHIVLLKRIFGGQADSILIQIRRAFTFDVLNTPIDLSLSKFPVDLINNNIKKDTTVGDEFVEDLLYSQKDDQYSFSILSLLYPDMDYKNNNFHKDHIHPEAHYKNVPDSIKEEYGWWSYNSIYNLQILDANENMAKKDKSLIKWIDENTTEENRKTFLVNHLIPDIDLSLENFGEYFEKRKEMLLIKIKKILN